MNLGHKGKRELEWETEKLQDQCFKGEFWKKDTGEHTFGNMHIRLFLQDRFPKVKFGQMI